MNYEEELIKDYLLRKISDLSNKIVSLEFQNKEYQEKIKELKNERQFDAARWVTVGRGNEL